MQIVKSIPNLHSTMVLLKSKLNEMHKTNAIKSTFHYGSIKIISHESNNLKQHQSTFHYGSIKIRSLTCTKYKTFLSTFHYGSIKM